MWIRVEAWAEFRSGAAPGGDRWGQTRANCTDWRIGYTLKRKCALHGTRNISRPLPRHRHEAHKTTLGTVAPPRCAAVGDGGGDTMCSCVFRVKTADGAAVANKSLHHTHRSVSPSSPYTTFVVIVRRFQYALAAHGDSPGRHINIRDVGRLVCRCGAPCSPPALRGMLR